MQLDVAESGIAAAEVLHPARRQVEPPPAALDLEKTRGKAGRQELPLPRFCSKKDRHPTDFFIETQRKVIEGGVLPF